MNTLCLDIKVHIASFDIHVWLKLYMLDDEIQHFTLTNQMFHQTFRKKVEVVRLKKGDIILLKNKLCTLNNISWSKSQYKHKILKSHICGKSVFTNIFCEDLYILPTIVVYK